MSRVLETVLTGRNLLSPMLASASADVVAFNSTVAGANEKAAASATASARVQQASATSSAAASGKAATASTVSAGTQSAAADKIAASNVKASTSATTSASTQSKAHARAAESATLSARVQESANNALARSNGLLGTSLTPLTAGLSAGALALGYAAYRGMEFDKVMSQVQAATMASAGTMNQLRDAAIDQGAKTKYSSGEAAQGITEMAKAGVSTTDILNGGLAGALNLAAAGQLEVAEASEVGATALTVFGLKGDKMSHVADLLAAGAGKAQGSVHDMAAAMNQSALVANQMGLSVEDTAGALAMFASNGLTGSDAGTSFKSMLQRLNPQSVEAANLMDQLGLRAYDAQGNFVGLAGYADKLKGALSGMSEEQRNATLTTLFGSDAVRAAAVLYKEGGAGVQAWTKNVNDAGYAAKQAAINQDNLSGDLEKLGGAFDSLMTSIGSGVQGPLRDVVQAFTAIVNVGGDVLGFWNSLPGPVQVAILTLAGVAALKGPVSSALETIALKALYMGESMAGASFGMGGLKAAGAGLLGFFGGPWGLAITGATVGLSLLVSWLSKSDDTTSELTTAQRSLKDAIAATNGVIDESVRKTAAKALQDQHLLDFTDLYGVKSQDMVGYVLGESDAHDRVSAALQRYRSNLESKLTGDKDADIVTQGLIGAVDTHIAALDGLATGTDTQIGKERQLAEATGQTSGAVAGATTTTADLTAQLQATADAASAAKQETDLFKLSLDILTGAHVSVTEAESAMYAALDSAKGAMDNLTGSVLTNAGELDVQSEAGRKAQDVLHGIRDAGHQYIATLIEQGATAETALKADADLRAGFIQSAGQMGISSEAANRLADEILGIPSEREAKIRADTAQADAALAETQRLLDLLKSKTITVTTKGIRVGNPGAYTGGGTILEADGGIVKYYASGGFHRENHVAQVASAGVTRVWAEPETGGELYAPLAASKRQRSLAVIGTQLDEWGYGMVPRGREMGGGFAVAPAAMPGYASSAAPAPIVVHHHHYDESRKTDIAVDATGFNADLIARKVADAQRVEEFLSA